MRRPGTRFVPWLLAAALGAASLAGCTAGGPSVTAPTGASDGTVPPAASDGAATASAAPSSELPLGPDGRPFAVDPVARFSAPWALSFLPGTDWLAITERTGRLHLRDQRSGALVAVSGVPQVVVAGQGGLGDVVPAPDFTRTGLLYLSWVEARAGGTGAVVGRARLVTDGASARLEGLEVIWRQEPATSGTGHFSHRLVFAPDGRSLFVSSGDRQKLDPAQDLSNTLGTIVRLTLDGDAAPGNPFADRGGVSAEIYSYGHRNPLGLAFDEAGALWSTEMGPAGGDELNLIVAGRNYGWPLASNGSHYSGIPIPDHAPGDGFEAPRYWWTPSVSPGSLLIYTGDAFAAWRGDALIGALSGQALIRVDLEGSDAVASEQWDLGQRIRAVAQDPDGTLWLLEDAPGGRLLHLTVPA